MRRPGSEEPSEATTAFDEKRYSDFLRLTGEADPLGTRLRRIRALEALGRHDEASALLGPALVEAEHEGGGLLLVALEVAARCQDPRGSLERAVALARSLGDPGTARRLTAQIAETHAHAGRLRAAEATLLELAEEQDDAYVCYVRGELAYASTALDEATAWYLRAEARAAERDDLEGVVRRAIAEVRRGSVAFTQDRLAEADACFRAALGRLEGIEGCGYHRSMAYNGLGECARTQGDLEAAEVAYRAAIALAPTNGMFLVNLALVAFERGKFAEADAAARGVDQQLPMVAAVAALLRAAVAAQEGDAERFDAAFRPFVARAPAESEPDIARIAGRIAASAAGHRGWLGRAVRARRVALTVWVAAGRRTAVAREERAIRRLGDEGAPVALGPFELESPLARGAFGEVWRARHVAGERVAIKVLLRSSPGQAGALDNELRAVAGLDHPNVVRLLDHGRVDRTAALLGRLHEGAPWIATELAEGGTLADRLGLWTWPEVRAALSALLDALAHAHARDLLHLDVKPANVLLAGGVPKLADFGLARAAGDGLSAGTPSYMAPEQFEGRGLGPWTDLYAVGCVAAALVSGTPPFSGDTSSALRQAHRTLPPSIQPVIEVPIAFLPWVRRLLVKRPTDRFRRAADAARSLVALGDVPRGSSAGTRRVGSTAARLLPAEVEPTVVLAASTATEPIELDLELAAIPRPDGPASWSRQASLPPSLADAGIALFGLRAAPFVGRERERDTLWDLLREVTTRRVLRAVVVEGPAGVGKSALAAWLCERAHELGAAEILVVRSGLGLRFALARMFEGADLADPFPGADAARLALLAASLERSSALGRAERNDAFAWAIRRVSERRPVVLWADDPDPEVWAVVERLKVDSGSVLALLTARSAPSTTIPTLALAPLSSDTTQALIASLVPLAPEIRERVARVTRGDPRFAIQLVTDLVHGGRLEPAAGGAVFRPGDTGVLPTALQELWARRVRSALVGLAPQARSALRVAGWLAPTVSDAVWQDAVLRAGLSFAVEGRGALVAARLAVAWSGGWTFEDPAVSEVLRGTSEPTVRAACGAALDAAGAPAEGVAVHFEQAGDAVRAWQTWQRALREQGAVVDPDRLQVLMARYVAAAATVGRQAEAELEVSALRP